MQINDYLDIIIDKLDRIDFLIFLFLIFFIGMMLNRRSNLW